MPKAIALIITILLPFFVSVSAVVPDVLEYKVKARQLSSASVSEWWSNYREKKALRDELMGVRLGILQDLTGANAESAAENLLDGVLDVRGIPRVNISIPFAAADMEQGQPAVQLNLASLLVADIFLEAFTFTGREMYLQHAVDYTERFLAYEEDLWLPTAYIWNDHAIAARTLFLTRLIDVAMESGSVSHEVVGGIFRGLDNSLRLLAKPSQFTYRTNHGMVQSLAVLHVAAFNRGVPAVSDVLDGVIGRLEEQMRFFVSVDGVVPEHSAGYQEFGVTLLVQAIRYFDLLDIPVPASWPSKRSAAEKFYNHMMRPDGTVPRYGDTSDKAVPNPNLPDSAFWLSEDFGYWVSRTSRNTHLFVPWANLPGGAHKHADELAVLFWYENVEWWTATGYWPYGHPRQISSFGWAGSNAPHQAGESATSERSSRIVNWLDDDNLRLLHLRRQGPGNYQVDRLIVEDKDGFWFVIDAPNELTETNTLSSWMTTDSVDVNRENAAGVFRLSSHLSTGDLRVNTLTGPDTSFEWQMGSMNGGTGWLAIAGKAMPTNTLVAETTAGSWALLAWALDKGNQSAEFMEELDWASSENWRLRYDSGYMVNEIEYSGSSLIVRKGGREETRTTLVAGRQNLPELQKSEHNYRILQEKYSRYRDLLSYRIRASIVLFIVAVCQLIGLLAYYLRYRRILPVFAMTTSWVIWLGMAIWMHSAYFV